MYSVNHQGRYNLTPELETSIHILERLKQIDWQNPNADKLSEQRSSFTLLLGL